MQVKALLLGAFLVGALPMAQAQAQDASLELLGGKGIVRLQMEARQGAIGRIELGPEMRSLLVEFSEVDAQSLSRMVDDWAGRNPLISAAAIQRQGDTVQLLVDFNQSVGVLDETMVALDQDRTRLELVLGAEAAKPAELLDPALPAPQLEDIGIVRRGDTVEIALGGNASLVASVSFRDQPPGFVVDLPGIATAALQERVDALGRGGLPELIDGLRVQQGPAGASRLLLDLRQPADLVASSGVLRDGNSILRMQLVGDRGAAGAADAARLESMALEQNRGRMEFVLKGTEGADVRAYSLEQPSRLMLDFLGWQPDQVLSALETFNREGNPGIQAVRYGESRLGSARVELELAQGVQLTDMLVQRLPADGREKVVIAMDAPGLTQALAGVPPVSWKAHMSGLDMRYSPAHDFGSEPSLLIQPLVLENSAQWAGARPKPGQDFELMSLYGAALENDARYQAAQAEYRAVSEVIPQARAGYLPVAAFSSSAGMVYQDVLRASNATFPTGDSSYRSVSMALTITQPIVKMPALVKMEQADISVEQAKVTLLAAEQDLLMRVAEQYLNMLAARDALELAQAERESMSKQLELARTSLSSGVGNITQLHDAEGRYALAQAKEIAAMNDLDVARMQLKEIVGVDVGEVQGFKRDFAAVPPQPAEVGPWVEAALAQNLSLRARDMAREVAQLEIKRQRAGHMPTLDLVGSVDRSDTGGSLYGSGQKVNNAQLMLQLNVPLYSGGLTSSMVREATARWEQSKHQLDEESRHTETLARAAFMEVLTSAESLAALRKMVNAQESALDGRLEGFKAGLYDIVDVIDGYRLYYAARRDYLKARYTYLINRLRLKQAVGTLSRDDLAMFARLM